MYAQTSDKATIFNQTSTAFSTTKQLKTEHIRRNASPCPSNSKSPIKLKGNYQKQRMSVFQVRLATHPAVISGPVFLTIGATVRRGVFMKNDQRTCAFLNRARSSFWQELRCTPTSTDSLKRLIMYRNLWDIEGICNKPRPCHIRSEKPSSSSPVLP